MSYSFTESLQGFCSWKGKWLHGQCMDFKIHTLKPGVQIPVGLADSPCLWVKCIDCYVINCFCDLKIHLVTLQSLSTFKLGHPSAYTSIPAVISGDPLFHHGILIIQFSFAPSPLTNKLSILQVIFFNCTDGKRKTASSFLSHLLLILLAPSFSVKESHTHWP